MQEKKLRLMIDQVVVYMKPDAEILPKTQTELEKFLVEQQNQSVRQLGPMNRAGNEALQFYFDCTAGKQQVELKYQQIKSEKAMANTIGQVLAHREHAVDMGEKFKENPDMEVTMSDPIAEGSQQAQEIEISHIMNEISAILKNCEPKICILHLTEKKEALYGYFNKESPPSRALFNEAVNRLISKLEPHPTSPGVQKKQSGQPQLEDSSAEDQIQKVNESKKHKHPSCT
jgi:hypothetical protein